MKRAITKLLFSLLIIYFQVNIVQAETKHLSGNFVAFEWNWGNICFDFCTSKAIFKIEKPKSMKNQYIIVFVHHLVSQSQESIFTSASRLEIKIRKNKDFKDWEVKEFIPVIDSETEQPIKSDLKAWRFIKGAENEKLPFGQKLKVVELAEPLETILKRLKN